MGSPFYLAAFALLPGTAQWDFPKDIVAEQYAELRSYYERELRKPAPAATPDQVRKAIGAIDTLLPPKPRFKLLSETRDYKISQVDWPAARIGGSGATVNVYGLLLEPDRPGRHPARVVMPGVAAANHGEVVFAPLFTERRKFSQPWLDDREWLFRLAYQTGRHIIGTEVQQVISAVDMLSALPSADPSRISVEGRGEGASTARYAALLDARIKTAWIEDEQPAPLWEQPVDRALFSRSEFKLANQRPAGERGSPVAMRIDPDEASRIANAQFAGWQAYYRNRVLDAYAARDALPLEQKRAAYFDMIGRYPVPEGSFDAKSAQVYDTAEVAGYRVSVQVYEGVHAYGILLVPKSLRPGERRPLIFTQHGLAGIPEHALGVEENVRADAVYRKFGLQLARRGYLVFAPMISTQTQADRLSLNRRSNPLGLTPAGMDLRKASRMLDFFSTLGFVDKDRFAFYGLSYGGYTSLWIGPGEPRFKVVITSGHFNDWSVKTTDPTLGTSYMLYADQLDMYHFGVLQSLNHSDLAILMAPRPYMIEMGDSDGVIVSPRRFADAEIQRVTDHYRALGMADRMAVARFKGPHRIDGAETFAFLDRWLKQ